jgi:hypothetical protein
MFNDDKYSSLALVVLMGIFIQIILVTAEGIDTPHRAVLEFAKAYYTFDPSMSERICEERRRINDADMVSQYILAKSREARDHGFDLKYMKAKLYHADTHTISKDDTSAKVRFTADAGSGINPVFAYVAKLFGFSKPREIEQTFDLIKESGKWRVCGSLFSQLEN